MNDTATAFIVWDKKILLFHRDNISTIPDPDMWQFPGGHIDKGETPEVAVHRELTEEVSYIPLHLTYVGQRKLQTHSVHLFWAYVTDDEAQQFQLGNGEGQEIGWYTLDDALQLNLTPTIRGYLTYYYDLLSTHIEAQTILHREELIA